MNAEHGLTAVPAIITISVPFLVLAVLLATANWLSLLASFRRRGTHRASLVPFVGAVLGGIGLSLSPSLPPWVWGLLLLDPGTLSGLLSLPVLLRTLYRFSPLNLYAEYSGAGHRLRLYRHGEFLLDSKFPPPSQDDLPLLTGAGGSWCLSQNTLVLKLQGHILVLSPVQEGSWLVLRGPTTSGPMGISDSTSFYRRKPRA